MCLYANSCVQTAALHLQETISLTTERRIMCLGSGLRPKNVSCKSVSSLASPQSRGWQKITDHNHSNYLVTPSQAVLSSLDCVLEQAGGLSKKKTFYETSRIAPLFGFPPRLILVSWTAVEVYFQTFGCPHCTYP